MKASVTDELCTQCGLCCDGSLFEDVELDHEREALGLEVMGLSLDEDDHPSLRLPCTALQGKLCGIYAHRPGSCRRFKCKLLERTEQGEVPLDSALKTVNKALKLSGEIRKSCRELEEDTRECSLRETCQNVLENFDAEKDPHKVLYRNLTKKMDLMKVVIKDHFVDE